MDFTGKYIEATYQKVLHIHSGSVYDGTGSLVSPTFSQSISVHGDVIVTSGSVYVDGEMLGGATDTASYAYTDRMNYFTGSQYIDASQNRYVESVYSYSSLVRSTHTGSDTIGFIGLGVDDTIAPTTQLSTPYVYGIHNTPTWDSDTSCSVFIGNHNLSTMRQGYVGTLYGINSSIRSYEYAEKMVSMRPYIQWDGHVENGFGFLLEGINRGGTIDNQYGMYISSSFFSATGSTNSYAFYSEPNVPSYFGGQIQSSGSIVLDTSENRLVDGDWTYGILNAATYTGSFRGFTGIDNSNMYAPTEQLSNVWLFGINNIFNYNAPFTGSGVHTYIQNTKIQQGYVVDAFGMLIQSRVLDGAVVENYHEINMHPRHSGHKEFHSGLTMDGYDLGGSVENMYGLYITDNYFPANISSQSYAIYSEPNVPSYFGGKIDASISAPTSSVTPTSSGSIAFQLDESNNKIIFQVMYSDGTIKSGSTDLS